MFNAIDISTSGLVAQRVRMNTIALNIANSEVVHDAETGTPYQRRAVIFNSGQNPADRSGSGVHVAAIEKQATFRYRFDPSNPYANQEGYVKMPAIDTLVEMANGMEAQRAYEANLAAIEISKAMLNSSLRILA